MEKYNIILLMLHIFLKILLSIIFSIDLSHKHTYKIKEKYIFSDLLFGYFLIRVILTYAFV